MLGVSWTRSGGSNVRDRAGGDAGGIDERSQCGFQRRLPLVLACLRWAWMRRLRPNIASSRLVSPVFCCVASTARIAADTPFPRAVSSSTNEHKAICTIRSTGTGTRGKGQESQKIKSGKSGIRGQGSRGECTTGKRKRARRQRGKRGATMDGTHKTNGGHEGREVHKSEGRRTRGTHKQSSISLLINPQLLRIFIPREEPLAGTARVAAHRERCEAFGQNSKGKRRAGAGAGRKGRERHALRQRPRSCAALRRRSPSTSGNARCPAERTLRDSTSTPSQCIGFAAARAGPHHRLGLRSCRPTKHTRATLHSTRRPAFAQTRGQACGCASACEAQAQSWTLAVSSQSYEGCRRRERVHTRTEGEAGKGAGKGMNRRGKEIEDRNRKAKDARTVPWPSNSGTARAREQAGADGRMKGRTYVSSLYVGFVIALSKTSTDMHERQGEREKREAGRAGTLR
ncbi:hypothetical protein FB451DRAFT_1170440 [Mycena latifolia]|nr:hypothetical protein FB451DRAFT_1170440 [Mycena latifolia]